MATSPDIDLMNDVENQRQDVLQDQFEQIKALKKSLHNDPFKRLESKLDKIAALLQKILEKA